VTNRHPIRSQNIAEAKKLAWMVIAVVVAMSPHLAYLPSWIPLAGRALAGWRIAAAWRGDPLPSRLIRLVLALAGFGGVFFTFRGQLNGLDPGTSLLAVMLFLKLLETARQRDYMMLCMFATFLPLAAFLREQSGWSLFYLLATLLLLISAMLQAGRDGRPLPVGSSLAQSARLLLQAAPLAIVLFLLFPRLPGAFWTLPRQQATSVSGLSEEMRPGDVSKLVLSEEVAFRAKFDGQPPPPSQRYWRALVLEEFDGRAWRQAKQHSWRAPPGTLETSGDRIDYEIVLEPHGRNWLFVLDLPTAWPREATLFRQLQLRRTSGPIDTHYVYRASSDPGARESSPINLPIRRLNTMVTSGANPRSRALAAEIRASASDDAAFVDQVLAFFGDNGFTYTLDPAAVDPRNPVDDFLFKTREGFCEYYASALATLARAAGIPARVITGYLGGELNPVGDYYMVRQADAHAWTEIWLDGTGWTRVDPTAAVAPGRIRSGIEETLEIARRDGSRNWQLLRRLQLYWDAADTYWNRWVINYSQPQQFAVLNWLGFSRPDSLAYLFSLLAGSLGAIAILVLWLNRSDRRGHRDAVAEEYRRFCGRLRRLGIDRPSSEGPVDFAARAIRQRPDLAGPIREITDCYVAIRYGRGDSDQLFPLLRTRIRRFRPARRHRREVSPPAHPPQR
jgi:transglutaminase-like putative cysteine protease